MEKVGYITHRGVQILHVDYSGVHDVAGLKVVADEATGYCQREPAHSILAILDLRGSRYSLRLARTLAEVAVANAPYVKARAMVGLPEAARPAIDEVAGFSGRPTRLFVDFDAALDWLAEQADQSP